MQRSFSDPQPPTARSSASFGAPAARRMWNPTPVGRSANGLQQDQSAAMGSSTAFARTSTTSASMHVPRSAASTGGTLFGGASLSRARSRSREGSVSSATGISAYGGAESLKLSAVAAEKTRENDDTRHAASMWQHEANVTGIKNMELRKQLEFQRKLVDELQEKCLTACQARDNAEAALAEQEKQLEELAIPADIFRNEIRELNMKLRQSGADRETLATRAAEQQAQQSKLTAKITELTSTIAKQKAEISNMVTMQENWAKKFEEAQAVHDELKEELQQKEGVIEELHHSKRVAVADSQELLAYNNELRLSLDEQHRELDALKEKHEQAVVSADRNEQNFSSDLSKARSMLEEEKQRATLELANTTNALNKEHAETVAKMQREFEEHIAAQSEQAATQQKATQQAAAAQVADATTELQKSREEWETQRATAHAEFSAENQKLKDNLEECRVQAIKIAAEWTKKLADAENKTDQLEGQVADLREQSRVVQVEYERVQGVANDLKASSNSTEAELRSINADLNAKVQQLESALEEAKQESSQLRASLDNTSSEKDAAQSELLALRGEKQDLESKVQVLQVEVSGALKDRDELSSQVESGRKSKQQRGELEKKKQGELEEAKKSLELRINTLEKELEVAQASAKQMLAERESIDARATKLSSDVAALAAERDELDEQVEQMRQERKTERKKLKDLEAALAKPMETPPLLTPASTIMIMKEGTDLNISSQAALMPTPDPVAPGSSNVNFGSDFIIQDDEVPPSVPVDNAVVERLTSRVVELEDKVRHLQEELAGATKAVALKEAEVARLQQDLDAQKANKEAELTQRLEQAVASLSQEREHLVHLSQEEEAIVKEHRESDHSRIHALEAECEQLKAELQKIRAAADLNHEVLLQGMDLQVQTAHDSFREREARLCHSIEQYDNEQRKILGSPKRTASESPARSALTDEELLATDLVSPPRAAVRRPAPKRSPSEATASPPGTPVVIQVLPASDDDNDDNDARADAINTQTEGDLSQAVATPKPKRSVSRLRATPRRSGHKRPRTEDDYGFITPRTPSTSSDTSVLTSSSDDDDDDKPSASQRKKKAAPKKANAKKSSAKKAAPKRAKSKSTPTAKKSATPKAKPSRKGSK